MFSSLDWEKRDNIAIKDKNLMAANSPLNIASKRVVIVTKHAKFNKKIAAITAITKCP